MLVGLVHVVEAVVGDQARRASREADQPKPVRAVVDGDPPAVGRPDGLVEEAAPEVGEQALRAAACRPHGELLFT